VESEIIKERELEAGGTGVSPVHRKLKSAAIKFLFEYTLILNR
jgi:hypothetical protein